MKQVCDSYVDEKGERLSKAEILFLAIKWIRYPKRPLHSNNEIPRKP